MQYKTLIWEENPFVDGILEGKIDDYAKALGLDSAKVIAIDEEPWATNNYSVNFIHIQTAKNLNNTNIDKILSKVYRFNRERCIYPFTNLRENYLDRIMLSSGLDDGERMHEPYITYKPQFKQKYNKVIFDPNWVTNIGDSFDCADIVAFFRANNIKLDAILAPRNDKSLFFDAGLEVIHTESLKDFCDLIYSSKAFYCFVTGSATLAAALHKSANVIYGDTIQPILLHSKFHNYYGWHHDRNGRWVAKKKIFGQEIKLRSKHLKKIEKRLPKSMIKGFRNLFEPRDMQQIVWKIQPNSAEISNILNIAESLLNDRGGG